jgi:hypothetical protein
MEEDLADIVAALEERVRRLEESTTSEPHPMSPPEGAFWALEGLKERAPDGGVMFTGAVTLPTGEYYEWQEGRPSGEVIDTDWGEAAPDLAATLGALGHPVRLLVLGLVLGGTRSVAELQLNDALGTTGQLYHHIRALVSAGWLRTTSRGHYAVPPDRIIPLLVILTAARR